MSGRLPAWLEEWFGLGTSAPGEGTVWRLDAQWNWPPWVTLLAIAAAVAWVATLYARESTDATRRIKGSLTLLRLGAVGVLVLMVSELVLTFQRTGLPTVAVILDVSGSMAVGVQATSTTPSPSSIQAAPGDPLPVSPVPHGPPVDGQRIRDGEVTRLDLAKELLAGNKTAWLRRIHRRYNLMVYTAATNATPMADDLEPLVQTVRTLSADGPGSEQTRLGTVLRQILSDLKGVPPTAIVLLSDGITTDGETLVDAAMFAGRRGVPLFTVALGDDKPMVDVELVDLLVDDTVFVGDILTFEARITARGLANTKISVQLRENLNDQILAETDVQLAPDQQSQTVRLPYRSTQAGRFEFTVEALPVDGEIQTENNRQVRIVSVHEEKIRVLLAQAQPNYEYRYLKHLLERDTTIQLHVHLQEADSEYSVIDQSAIPVFPVRREALFEYDVIILGDLDLQRMTRSNQTHLREFVEQKGGGLVLIAGDCYLPDQYRDVPELAVLFPFRAVSTSSDTTSRETDTKDAGFVLRPTELGLASGPMQLGDTPEENQRIWQELPALWWLLEIGKVKQAARVLAEHPTRMAADGQPLPVILLQFVGAGKVLFHATDETWRWRFRIGDTFFARYWIQSIRYLARSKLVGSDRGVALSVDQHEVRRGDAVRIRVRFFDETVAPAEDHGVTVVVERVGGKRRRIILQRDALHRGIFQAMFGTIEPGRYHVLLVQPTVEGRTPTDDFRVIAPPGELENITLDTDELAEAAAVSRGKYYPLDEAGDLLGDLPEGRQVPIQRLPPMPLWNRWWMILLFLGLLISEWVLRKRKGMM